MGYNAAIINTVPIFTDMESCQDIVCEKGKLQNSMYDRILFI